MKSIRLMIFSIMSFFMFILSVHAEATNFAPMISMDPDIKDGQVNVVLGFTGEEAMIINHIFSYDASKLKMVSVSAMDNFNVEVTDEYIDEKYRTISILADSDYSFNEVEYCVVTFEVLPEFKRKRTADIFVYNFEGIGPKFNKSRNFGQIMTMVRESPQEMYYTLNDITDKTKIEYWFKKYYMFLILGVVAVIGVFSIIMLIPSKRKQEQRDDDVGNQIKKENYDPKANFKLDQEKIEKIGVEEKPIDMNQAILVNENVKPFGDIIGKFDNEVTSNEEPSVQNNAPVDVNVFDNRTPDSLNEAINPFNMKANTDDSSDDIELLEDSGIHELDEDNLYQISSNVIEEANAPSVTELPAFSMNPINTQNNNTNNNIDVSNLSNEMPTAPQLQNNSENELNVSNNSTTNTDNNTNIMSVILLLFTLISIFTMSEVYAEEYDVDGIRSCILNRIEFDEQYDLNSDGICSIDDLLLTKNLEDCNFEIKMTNPEFREFQDINKNNRTTKVIQMKDRPTVAGGFRTTTRSFTVEKTTVVNGTKTNVTKSNGTMTNTTKSNGTKTNATVAKGTSAVTKVTQPNQPSKAVYTVTFKAVGGTPGLNSYNITEGESKEVRFFNNSGYVYKSSTCTNIDFSFNKDTYVLLVKNATGNATCTVTFGPRDKYDVVLRYISNRNEIKTETLSTTYNGSITKNINITGYTYKNHYCGVKGNYSNGTLKIENVTDDLVCELNYDVNRYKVHIKIPDLDSDFEDGPYDYGRTVLLSVTSSTCSYSKVSCNNNREIRVTPIPNGNLCSYNYNLTIGTNNECTIS